MAIVATISTEGNTKPTKSTVKPENTLQLRTSTGLGTYTRITDLLDVNAETLNDGSVLIYDLASKKFITKNEVDNPNTKIIGGSF